MICSLRISSPEDGAGARRSSVVHGASDASGGDTMGVKWPIEKEAESFKNFDLFKILSKI